MYTVSAYQGTLMISFHSYPHMCNLWDSALLDVHYGEDTLHTPEEIMTWLSSSQDSLVEMTEQYNLHYAGTSKYNVL